jgi:hypothetical protein
VTTIEIAPDADIEPLITVPRLQHPTCEEVAAAEIKILREYAELYDVYDAEVIAGMTRAEVTGRLYRLLRLYGRKCPK